MSGSKCDLCNESAKGTLFFNQKEYVLVCESCQQAFTENKEEVSVSLVQGDFEEAVRMIQKIIISDRNDNNIEPFKDEEKVVRNREDEEKGILETHGVDLNLLAKEGKIDKLVGRDKEIARLSEVLSRRTKNNAVIIGDAGVGKTAIAEDLAFRLVNGSVPFALEGKRIVQIDVASLMQGTSLRGQFEEKMQKLIKEMDENKDVILFIDEMHMLSGAGTTSSESGMDAVNILKPALARGGFQMIGATTLDEFREIEKDPAFARRFQTVIVKEPSVEETYDILDGIKSIYEQFHNIEFTNESLRAAIELSSRYIPERRLPDKAIDLLDEAGAKVNQDISQNKGTIVIQEEIIIELIEERTGIPISKLSNEEKNQLANLESTLAEKIIGQDTAIKKVAQSIRRNRMGFRKENRPVGTFMFVGPTGTGKTQLAKALSSELFSNKDSFIRLDMSEYMEKHSVSKLIGSPPGYEGHKLSGQLTEKIRRNPFSLLLVDEIEKAHPDVLNIFLQVLDDGHLTDSKGETVSFKDCLIIMTSNAGITETKAATVGFGASSSKKSDILERLDATFRPEFLNRFDGVIEFDALDKNHLMSIVELLLKETYQTMKKKGVSLTIEQKVKDEIVEKGYNPFMGARPLRRMIEEFVEDKLAVFYMENQEMESVHLGMIDGKIVAIEQLAFKFLEEESKQTESITY